jgi:hypothetical protein
MEPIKLFRPSNGTTGDAFHADWCEKCARMEEPCPILGAALFNNIDEPDFPQEWRYNASNEPCCTGFAEDASQVAPARCDKTFELF